jgi:hypothetical protein
MGVRRRGHLRPEEQCHAQKQQEFEVVDGLALDRQIIERGHTPDEDASRGEHPHGARPPAARGLICQTYDIH